MDDPDSDANPAPLQKRLFSVPACAAVAVFRSPSCKLDTKIFTEEQE